MEHVELVLGHLLEQLLDLGHALHMPRGIQHQPAPDEARLIADVQRLHPYRTAVCVRRKQLQDGDGAVEQAGVIARADADAVSGDIQRVAFAVTYRGVRVQRQHDRPRIGAALPHRQVQSANAHQLPGQPVRRAASGAIASGDHDGGVCIDLKLAAGQFEPGRQRNQRRCAGGGGGVQRPHGGESQRAAQ